MNWHVGDRVEYVGLSRSAGKEAPVFRGVIEGFFGKDQDMAMCTDQTGLGSRPVAVKRLRRPSTNYWSNGQVA